VTAECPASVAQRLLWMAERYQAAEGAFNIPLAYRLRGPLDEGALKEAVRLLAVRHEALRTTLHRERHGLVQRVHEAREIPVTSVDVRRGDTSAAEKHLRTALRTPVDAGVWPFRLNLVRVAADDHLVCLVNSHLACDGWSSDILARELGVLYSGLVETREVTLPEPSWQYRDFSHFQAERLFGTASHRLRAYWRERLEGARLPRLRPDGTVSARSGWVNVLRFAVRAETAERLAESARRRRGSLFTALLAILNALVADRTGDPDVTIGSVYANRTRREAMGTVGCFAHTLLLRTDLGAATGFPELFDRTRVTTNGAFAHQELPSHLLPPGLVPGAPGELVFHMMAEPARHPELSGLGVEPLFFTTGLAGRWGLELLLTPTDDGGLHGDLYHDVDQYDDAWAAGFAMAYTAACDEHAEKVRT
jgi:hypothetical protein